jgi:flagellar biogenesis protein FliO
VNVTDLEMLLRVLGSLVAVVALALVAARLARRAGVCGGGVGLRVVDRIGLTRDGALTVVEVSGRVLVLGVTPSSVTMVTELDPACLAAPPAEAASSVADPSVTEPSVTQPSVTEPVVPQQARPKGTGSVLDPRTWGQGLDALRELTVRR